MTEHDWEPFDKGTMVCGRCGTKVLAPEQEDGSRLFMAPELLASTGVSQDCDVEMAREIMHS